MSRSMWSAVKDATDAFELEGMHVAHEVNGTRFAHASLQQRSGGVLSRQASEPCAAFMHVERFSYEGDPVVGQLICLQNVARRRKLG